MSATTTKPLVTPHSLQGRTARAMYERIAKPGDPGYLALGNGERERYEEMAAAALQVALRESVTT